MSNSTHRVDVFRISDIEVHQNADSLGIVRTPSGHRTVIGLDGFRVGDLVAFVQPDSVVDRNLPCFSFLKSDRVKVIKLRGEVSHGLLVKAPEGVAEGDDAAELLKVKKYVGPDTDGGEDVAGPAWLYAPTYDLESARRYGNAVIPFGTPIVMTEKIHGENGRWVYSRGEFWCGSRTRWKATGSGWHQALDHHPEIRSWLKANPDMVVYGEKYGRTGGFPYDAPKGQSRIRIFDIMDGNTGEFLDFADVGTACALCGLPMVPVIGETAFRGVEELLEYAEGKSTLNDNHVREGIVIRPLRQTWESEYRPVLKLVGDGFLFNKNS